MKRRVLYFCLILFCTGYYAQQFPQYTQFIFNKIGYNPAASGTHPGALFEIVAGARTQWIGVNNNPKSEFISFNYNLVPQRSYSKWHNVGIYIDQDQNGNFLKNDIWLSYTFHLMLTKKMIMSAGIFAGIKYFKLNISHLDKNDPAVAKSAAAVIAYPDIVPGVRISSKRFFADVSLQQVTMFSQKGIGGQIGSPSKLTPHYNFSIGKKGAFNDYNTMMLAVNVHGTFKGLPSAEINIMNYYDKKFALGASLRSRNYVCAIIQFRLLHNLNVGFAYDLSINKMLYAAPNNAEIMISISPVFGGELSPDRASHRSVNECTF
jgi:type IX secretion system PorP/SprF family membrane protein